MGCGASAVNDEDPPKVVVFGALGMVGGAVATALVRSPKLRVIAVTRTPTSNKAHGLAEKGAVISTANLNDPRSLERVMEGAYAVFLTTHYWEHLSKEKEISQGINAIDMAEKCKIKHFIMYGSEPPSSSSFDECGHFEAKAKIEAHLKSKGIPYTVLRMPFFYENITTVFKPHKLKENKYAITLPLENDVIDGMSVSDMGRCVLNILLKPQEYLWETLNLAVDKISTQHMADSLTRHLAPATFVCPSIRIEDYANFKFSGAKDLAATFEHYRSFRAGSGTRTTKKLCSSALTLDKWVTENKAKILDSLKEEEELLIKGEDQDDDYDDDEEEDVEVL